MNTEFNTNEECTSAFAGVPLCSEDCFIRSFLNEKAEAIKEREGREALISLAARSGCPNTNLLRHTFIYPPILSKIFEIPENDLEAIDKKAKAARITALATQMGLKTTDPKSIEIEHFLRSTKALPHRKAQQEAYAKQNFDILDETGMQINRIMGNLGSILSDAEVRDITMERTNLAYARIFGMDEESNLADIQLEAGRRGINLADLNIILEY